MEQKRFFVTAKNQDLSLGYLSGPVSPPFNNPFCAERAIKKPLLSNRRRGFKSFLPSLSPLPRSIAGAFPLPWIAHETSSEAKGLLQNGRKGKAAATAPAKKRRLIVPRFPPFYRKVLCTLLLPCFFGRIFPFPPPSSAGRNDYCFVMARKEKVFFYGKKSIIPLSSFGSLLPSYFPL